MQLEKLYILASKSNLKEVTIYFERKSDSKDMINVKSNEIAVDPEWLKEDANTIKEKILIITASQKVSVKK